MAAERFITLVIHTYDRAVTLRKILESHGSEVRFENLVISGAHIASGVRVKISETDLPLALKIIESGDLYAAAKAEMKMAGENGNILIPVDFSSYSMLACKVGFVLAERLSLHPVILHAYATPYFMGAMNYGEGIDGNLGQDVGVDFAEMQAGRDIRKEGERQMHELKKKIEQLQKEGTLPDIRFATMLNEGVPEEVILEYCRLTPPALVVMATRGKDKKEEDLVGSITAEVLDSCRVPVFAIPENCDFTSVDSFKRLAYFCNLDQHDILSVDTLMRMFGYPELDVALIPVNDRAGNKVRNKVDNLRDYFNKNYPTARFSSEVFSGKDFREDFERFVEKEGIELLIVPNKKKNVFSRLFNPGIPHKILFERDMPLLALPV